MPHINRRKRKLQEVAPEHLRDMANEHGQKAVAINLNVSQATVSRELNQAGFYAQTVWLAPGERAIVERVS